MYVIGNKDSEDQVTYADVYQNGVESIRMFENLADAVEIRDRWFPRKGILRIDKVVVTVIERK